jgi:hypothetical protein
VLLVGNPLNRRQSNAAPGVRPSPTAAASSTPDSNLPAFTCVTYVFIPKEGGPTQPPVVSISQLRTGTHGDYDRVTIEFGNGIPTRTQVAQISGTTFTQSPSGMQVKLKGSNAVLVTMDGVDLHTSYQGSTDIVTGYPALAELRRVQDFEGVVQLALGVNGTGCYRAFFLTNPSRLVIDVPTGS